MKIVYSDKNKVESVSVCYVDHLSEKESCVSADEWLNGEGITIRLDGGNGSNSSLDLTYSQITVLTACFELLGVHDTDEVDAVVKEVLKQKKHRTDTINEIRAKYGIKE